MYRNVIYFWRINLAVICAVAIATAVLTGALIIGDSVRGSLKNLTLDRLGETENAITSHRYFRESLAIEIGKNSVPIIALRAAAIHSETNARASKINIYAVPPSFDTLFRDNQNVTQFLTKRKNQIFQPIAINAELQRELNAKIGDQILITFERPTDIHREFLLGRREFANVVQTVRLTVSHVIDDRGVGRFGLRPDQHFPLNIFVDLDFLQKTIGKNDQINTLLIPQSEKFDSQSIKNSIDFSDLGLTVRNKENNVVIESDQFLINPQISKAIEKSAVSQNLEHKKIFTYLANSISANGKIVPYSMISAIDHDLAENEIILNNWTLENLRIGIGDEVEISYFVADVDENLIEKSAKFRFAGVVEMAEIDDRLTPKLPGVSATNDMTDWDVPFPIDLEKIRDRDEDYWDKFGATPKALISLSAGRRLWTSRFGDLTSIQVFANSDQISRLQTDVIQNLTIEQIGFQVQNVRSAGISASSGSTDFSGLFIGFSFFLIISAALLIGLLFRLGLENRLGEIGTLRAIGFPIREIKITFLLEGFVLSCVGAVIGSIASWFYSKLLIFGLQTLWMDSIAFLSLIANPLSFAIGIITSVIITMTSIILTIRKIGEIEIVSLIRKRSDLGISERRSVLTKKIFVIIILLIAIGSSIFGSRSENSAIFFFISGSLLLIAGLTIFTIWLNRSHNIKNMAIGNCARRSGRSLISTALVAFATFVIVAVGASRHAEIADLAGTGGFDFVAESDLPIHESSYNFNNSDIFACRSLPGEDVSCLNLYRPQKPRLISFPTELIDRGGFEFQQTIENFDGENALRLLDQALGEDLIPTIGDYNSVKWILHLGIGDQIIVTNELGKEIKLLIVGLLRSSIFQSELIVSESNFTKNFPSRSGYRYFLINSPDREIAELLEDRFSDFGFDATSTIEKLKNFRAVENTYISVFQAIGGLGFLLGTIGLAIIIFRSVIERRGELAMLRAIGFRRSKLAMILLIENSFLVLIGMMIGTISALVAIAPHLISTASEPPLISLAIILFVIIIFSICINFISVWIAIRSPLLSTLKSEI